MYQGSLWIMSYLYQDLMLFIFTESLMNVDTIDFWMPSLPLESIVSTNIVSFLLFTGASHLLISYWIDSHFGRKNYKLTTKQNGYALMQLLHPIIHTSTYQLTDRTLYWRSISSNSFGNLVLYLYANFGTIFSLSILCIISWYVNRLLLLCLIQNGSLKN